MNHVFSIIFFTFSMCITHSFAQPPRKEVACPSCFHLEFEIRNLPRFIKIFVESMLSGLKLSNPNCASNKVAPKACPKPLIPGLMENKCQTATINLKAVGIKPIFPDAELDVGVTIRTCESGWSGTVDKCMKLSEVDAATKAEITKKLKRVETQWNSVTYTGNVCIKTP
ncbi:uncharacterized protein LOC123532107 [Mercenaria mercenaria]|uniref:uncharacterized protein LOC123532107 n=1 Tax=Mercenaria mercenaria TaxID=6596 RepID=UPI001E1D7069|nr:uncharacterized protein LOC123532107 [Mercenaria mercenaria]